MGSDHEPLAMHMVMELPESVKPSLHCTNAVAPRAPLVLTATPLDITGGVAQTEAATAGRTTTHSPWFTTGRGAVRCDCALLSAQAASYLTGTHVCGMATLPHVMSIHIDSTP